MFEDDDDDEFPAKWLDKKHYIRIDPKTGKPQLVRVEPFITEGQEFIPYQVKVFVDDTQELVMGREEAEMYIAMTGCSPLEVAAQWKHKSEH